MRSTLFAVLAVALGGLNIGCIHDAFTYRVARDVRVNDSDTALRNGPLTLTPVDAAAPAPVAGPSLSDATLQQKMTARLKAKSDLAQAEPQLGPANAKVVQLKQLIAALDSEITQLTDQAGARHALAIANKPKTVLMITLDHSGPGQITTHPGGDIVDRYSRVFVLLLDQPLTMETVWATDENSMLIEYTPNTQPERTYVGVEGSFKIVSVSSNELVADVKLKMRSDVDDLDATLFRYPYKVSGRRRFMTVTPQDPLFRSGAVRWSDAAPVAHATTQPSHVASNAVVSHSEMSQNP